MNKNNKYIKNIVSKMTLDEKVGALLTLGFAGTLVRPHIYDDIIKYHCGGLRLSPGMRLFGNYTDPKTGKDLLNVEDGKGYKKGLNAPYVTASEYKGILDELQRAAVQRPAKIPLHFSFDQEGGTGINFNFGGVNIFPKPMGIRATGDSKLAYEAAMAIARQSRAVGFNWVHSPVLDINVRPDNYEIYTRAYSDNVEDVVEYAVETCRGFREKGLIATGKHFPGRGDSSVDAHFGIPVINADKKTILDRDLVPYRELIKRDLLPSVMLAHTIYPAIDADNVATVSKKIITGLLREELGFEGVITTDSMTMGGIAAGYSTANACALALEAGADLVLMKAENNLVEETFNMIKKFAEDGRISETELNMKVYRILSLKYEYGLFNNEAKESKNPDEVIHDKDIIDLSRLIARKSVLIARDDNKLLPLPRDKKVLIIEQINSTPNNFYWHPGILYKECIKYNRKAGYLETSYDYDEDDKASISIAAKDYETIVITNFYTRGKLSNNEFISTLLKDNSKKIIVITNTPFPISIPKGSDCLIITFATSPANIEAVAGVLFGETVPEGKWPLKQYFINK